VIDNLEQEYGKPLDTTVVNAVISDYGISIKDLPSSLACQLSLIKNLNLL